MITRKGGMNENLKINSLKTNPGARTGALKLLRGTPLDKWEVISLQAKLFDGADLFNFSSLYSGTGASGTGEIKSFVSRASEKINKIK